MTAKCTHAAAGTFGHECGKPATLASQKDSNVTADGKFWTFRCVECSTSKGRDNWGFTHWVKANPVAQVNQWR